MLLLLLLLALLQVVVVYTDGERGCCNLQNIYQWQRYQLPSHVGRQQRSVTSFFSAALF